MKSIKDRLLSFPFLIIVVVFLWVLWKGLNVNHSPLEEKSFSFPEFSLRDIQNPDKTLTLHDVKGYVSIVHVWASWCGICVREHQVWMALKDKYPYPLIGIVYRDDKKQVESILKAKGDPYAFVVDDTAGSLGVGLGIVGTPETFILDHEGIVRFQYLGPITQEFFETEMVPVIEKLRINEPA